MTFVDAPDRPAITHESHPVSGLDHTVTAWDWDGAQWVTFVVPCPENCSERQRLRRGFRSDYDLGYNDGWEAALTWVYS